MIAAGHPPAAVWSYTPRQITGFLWFARNRMNRERAAAISDAAAAARSAPKDLEKAVKELLEPK